MRIKVLNLDGVPDNKGETFDAAGVEVSTAEVPATLNFRTDILAVLGWAKLTKEADGVYAEIRFIHEGSEIGASLYPAVGGITKERVGSLIKACELRQLSLCSTRNADSRIEPIEVPLSSP
jgi:hypothetical protein